MVAVRGQRNPLHDQSHVTDEQQLRAELDFSKVSTWSSQDVAKWAGAKGFEEYAGPIMEHKISGKILPLLDEKQLKEMGFALVGPRLKFQKALREIQKGERQRKRKEILWEADQLRHGPCGGCLPFGFPCCCCAQPPAHYRLSAYKLSVSEANVQCPMCAQCCGYTFATNNIDLHDVQDVDTVAEQPGCCHGMAFVTVQMKNGEPPQQMSMEPERVQEVSQMIQQAVEEADLRSQAVIHNNSGAVF